MSILYLWLSRHMKAYRIAALSVALGIGCAALARAQAAPPAAGAPPQGGLSAGGARGNSQVAGIELSAEQKATLEAITVKYADENKDVRELMAADPVATMKRMMAVRERMLSEVRAVLTVEQRAIFDRNIAEMKVLMDARVKP